MTGLFDLLDRAATDTVEVDVAADLRRGRSALRRRRTRIAAGATGGLAVLGVLGAGGASLVPSDDGQAVDRSATQPGSQLQHTPDFDVPQAPEGWHLVGGNSFIVVYRKDGDPETYLDRDLVHALVLYLQDKSDEAHEGPAIPYNGRSFYEWGDGGAGLESMSVQQPDGDWLRMQYPKSAGFDSQDMIAFLDAVVVKDGARGTRG